MSSLITIAYTESHELHASVELLDKTATGISLTTKGRNFPSWKLLNLHNYIIRWHIPARYSNFVNDVLYKTLSGTVSSCSKSAIIATCFSEFAFKESFQVLTSFIQIKGPFSGPPTFSKGPFIWYYPQMYFVMYFENALSDICHTAIKHAWTMETFFTECFCVQYMYTYRIILCTDIWDKIFIFQKWEFCWEN